jgi:hypothetical protein
MSVGWKTRHRLLEQFAVKYGFRSSQTMSWGTKVDGHHDDLRKKIFIEYKEFFKHTNGTFVK